MEPCTVCRHHLCGLHAAGNVPFLHQFKATLHLYTLLTTQKTPTLPFNPFPFPACVHVLLVLAEGSGDQWETHALDVEEGHVCAVRVGCVMLKGKGLWVGGDKRGWGGVVRVGGTWRFPASLCGDDGRGSCGRPWGAFVHLSGTSACLWLQHESTFGVLPCVRWVETAECSMVGAAAL